MSWYVLSEYIDAGISEAEYEKLDNGSYSGRVPSCIGVIAFGPTLRQCEHELRSTLEDSCNCLCLACHPELVEGCRGCCHCERRSH